MYVYNVLCIYEYRCVYNVHGMCMSSLSIKENLTLQSDDKINIISPFGVMIRSI